MWVLPKLFAHSGQLELHYCELKTNGIQVDMCRTQLSYTIMQHTNNNPLKACQWRFSALLPHNTELDRNPATLKHIFSASKDPSGEGQVAEANNQTQFT
jgi:hypothetical protein